MKANGLFLANISSFAGKNNRDLCFVLYGKNIFIRSLVQIQTFCYNFTVFSREKTNIFRIFLAKERIL